MRNQSGIYKIQSKIKPERIYIGSSVNITERWQQHIKHLSENKHHSIKLQRHVLKYGIEDLSFSIIEPCFKNWLIIREQFYLNKLKPYFNIYKKANSPLGIKRSKETRKKYSEAKKGQPAWNKGLKMSPIQREAIRKANTGRKITEETRQKLKEKRKGRILSDESRKKISIANKGRKLPPISEETRKKISTAMKGKKLSEETKAKLREINKGNKYNLGHKCSEETKRKISEATKGKKRKPLSDERKKQISQRFIGNKYGVGNKNALGYRFSDEAKQKMRERLLKEWELKKRITNQEESLCN